MTELESEARFVWFQNLCFESIIFPYLVIDSRFSEFKGRYLSLDYA